LSSRAAAARYARALFDVALGQNAPEQFASELGTVVELVSGHDELQRALTNPSVPVRGKRGVIAELAGRLALSPAVEKTLLMLADRDRLTLLPDILAVYQERLMDHRHEVRAEVTTAVPLAEGAAARVQQTLSDVTGRRVTLTATVDPSIIGGLVTRIGGTVYDGSVATQLATLRQKLVGRV